MEETLPGGDARRGAGNRRGAVVGSSGEKRERTGRGGERERVRKRKGVQLLQGEETGVNRLNYTASNQSAPQGQKGGRGRQD